MKSEIGEFLYEDKSRHSKKYYSRMFDKKSKTLWKEEYQNVLKVFANVLE